MHGGCSGNGSTRSDGLQCSVSYGLSYPSLSKVGALSNLNLRCDFRNLAQKAPWGAPAWLNASMRKRDVGAVRSFRRMIDELNAPTPCPLATVFGDAEIGPHDMRPSLRVWTGIWRLDACQMIEAPEDLAILLVHLSGAPMTLQVSGKETTEQLTAGGIATLTSGTVSRLVMEDEADVLGLTFDEALIRMCALPVLARAPGHYELASASRPVPSAISSIAQILAQELSQDGAPKNACRAALILTLIEFLAADDRFTRRGQAGSSFVEASIARVIRLIDENISLDLSLDWLAAEAGVSPYHLSRKFRKAMGIGLAEYTTSRRLHAACRLLAETRRPLSEIAYDCGFSSQSRMNSVFRQQMDVTPLEYRKSCWGIEEGVREQTYKT